MATTSGDGGFWLVASDGGVFSFGDARFHGSMARQTLAPVVGMAADPATGATVWPLPEMNRTPAQDAQASTDTAQLNAFFGTSAQAPCS